MWINIAVGAVLGGFVGFILSFALRTTHVSERAKRVIQSICIGFAVVIGSKFVSPPLQLKYAMSQIEDQLSRTNPAFVAMKTHEPEAYAQVIARTSAGLEAGKTVPEIQVDVRNTITGILEKKLPVAADDSVLEYMRVTVLGIRELYVKNDEACYTYLFPESGPPFDITQRLTKATMDAEASALAAVISAASTNPQKRVSIDEFEADLAYIYLTALKKYGADVEMLNVPQTALPAKRRVCEMVVDLYENVFALPREKAGRIVRAMLSS